VSLQTILLVLAQVSATALVAWACGALLLGYLDRRLLAVDEPGVGTPERALLAALAFLAFCCVLMVGNIVTGGAVFGVASVVPICALAVVVLAIARHRPSKPRVPKINAAVIALVLVLGVLFALPVLVSGSGVRAGDPPWHLGWTEQLLAGEPVPTGPAPEFGRNAYPWGFHSILATMVRLVPGTDPLLAHESAHLFLIGLIPLGGACLARLVNRRAGPAAAWLASAVGGFAWISSGVSAFVASPSEARYGADLVVASPNSMYELFPPALPREVALATLAAATVLLALAIRADDRRLLAAAGIGTGIVGLISVPMMFTAVAWSLAVCAFAIKHERVRAGLIVLGAGAATFGLWAGPVFRDYIRYDGFVNITPQLGMEWNLGVALASWGVLLPLAIGGVVLLVMQPPVVSRPLVACVVASVILLGLAIARARFDWGLFGNETLLHQGRMWPPLHLLGAAVGGIALVTAYGWLRTRSAALATGALGLTIVIGGLSPVIAARGLTSILEHHAKGFDYAEGDLMRDAFVRRAAEHLGPRTVVRVEGSDELAFFLFQFSGTKIARYDDPRLIGNELRIRFSDLAAAWDRKAMGEGFEADYLVRLVPESSRAGEVILEEGVLEEGVFQGEEWEMVAVDG
jgi:hypothetical protein